MWLWTLSVIVVAVATATPLGGPGQAIALRIGLAAPERTVEIASFAAAVGGLVAPLVLFGPSWTRSMRSGNPRPDSPAGRANLHGWANVLTLGVAAAFGTAGHAMAQPTFGELGATGWGAGLGLLAASVPLGSMALAPPPNRSRPSPRGAAVLGLAIALGALPGCGPMTISVPVSAWLRARPREGVALVALAAVPIHALTVARHGSQLADLGSWEAIVGASVLGVGSAIGGLWALGKLADRGAIAWFAGITGPLGLALLATMWLGAA